MAKENSTQSAITTLEKKQLPARAGTYQCVLDMFEEQQEQLLALISSLENEVRPKDPKNPQDGENVTAWRLAQIAHEMLASTELLNRSRTMLMREAA